MLPNVAHAQQQSSAISGRVTDAQGNPASAAEITVIDTRSGTRRTTRSNDSGNYTVRNLAVGGPYEILLNGQKQTTVQSLSLGDVYQLPLVAGGAAANMEEVITVGRASSFSVAPGPAANFGLAEIETAVAFERDIKDVFAVDPRINVEGTDGAVNCTGKSPRFNTTTLDGVRYGDQFGLNDNGYGTATGMPFPFDAIEQVAVEIAPFDVRYGGFSACNINAVTKRGGNEWTGSFFYEYTSDSLRGDEFDGDQTFNLQDYDEDFYGISANGPLIQDKLFLSFAYEKQEVPRFLAQGFAGSGNGEERDWLSEADFNRIRDIAQNTYNYDPGALPGDGTQEGEKYFARLDWNISDRHQAAFVFNYYEGFQDRASDSDDNEFEFENHYYVKGDENTTYSGFLSSQWTDSFSTDIFLGTQEQQDSQVTVGPADFGDHQISDSARNTVYLGADDSRQANSLNYDATYLRLNAEYLFRDHAISFGYHREELDVFNLFVQHSNGGEYDYFDDSTGNPDSCAALDAQGRFDDPNCGTTGLDKFELGRPSRVYYGSAGGTNVAADAAADFTNTLNALFVQDDFTIGENLAVTIGLRYEWWETSDAPRFNQAFTDANGFRNDATIDGTDLFMPRVGLTWDLSDTLTLRGGFGLYSGGNPNVWLSNSYSNDGITNAQFLFANFDSSQTLLQGMPDSVPLSRQQRPGYDVPQELVDNVLAVSDADANDSELALVDPNYEQPAEWKVSVGATYDLNGWVFDADYLYTRGEDPAYYVDVSQEQVGETVLGQPIYDFVGRGENNFMLTNSNQNPEAHILSLGVRKYFDNGWDLQLGYAYTDAEDVSPMTSSVAASNFGNVALNDIVEPAAATSNYVVPHRFSFRAGYRQTLWGDNETRISFYGFAQEGRPQSYVMGSNSLEGDQFFGRHLLYVPTGIDDPAVVFEDSFDYAAFEAFTQSEGLGPGFQGRNANHSDWSYRLDMRIDQEFPFFADMKAVGYLKIYNVLNLLSSDLGVQTSPQFFSVQLVDSSVDDEGRYVFESFNDGRDINDIQEERSLWEMRLGFSLQF
ncbi:MAG: TonB-dependent receptor [Pseudomonadota bacterium]